MGAFERITVSVPVEMAAALRQSVEDGQYVTESDIVRDALDEWQRVRERRDAKIASVREALEKAQQGPWMTEEEAFARIEATLARHERV